MPRGFLWTGNIRLLPIHRALDEIPSRPPSRHLRSSPRAPSTCVVLRLESCGSPSTPSDHSLAASFSTAAVPRAHFSYEKFSRAYAAASAPRRRAYSESVISFWSADVSEIAKVEEPVILAVILTN